MLKERYAYPAVLHHADDGISIRFPDLNGCRPCAHTMDEAIKNAREAMGLHLYGMERDGEEIPEPSPIAEIKLEKNEMLLLVDVLMPPLRERINTRFVKKTLSIPNWLNVEAEQAGVNFSQLLQSSLKEYLHLNQ